MPDRFGLFLVSAFGVVFTGSFIAGGVDVGITVVTAGVFIVIIGVMLMAMQQEKKHDAERESYARSKGWEYYPHKDLQKLGDHDLRGALQHRSQGIHGLLVFVHYNDDDDRNLKARTLHTLQWRTTSTHFPCHILIGYKFSHPVQESAFDIKYGSHHQGAIIFSQMTRNTVLTKKKKRKPNDLTNKAFAEFFPYIKTPDNLSRIKSGAFHENFFVYTDNPLCAQRILTPAVQTQLLELHSALLITSDQHTASPYHRPAVLGHPNGMIIAFNTKADLTAAERLMRFGVKLSTVFAQYTV